MEYTFRPLSNWPGTQTPSYRRTKSRFGAGYTATLDLLDRELLHLKAKNVVFEADCDPIHIRLDGRLRSSAKMNGPGIVVSFDSKNGPMRFPCDRFTDWESNLRAIALTLEHLRAVDRYGVTQHAEQYKGWTALEDKRSATPSRATAIAWLLLKLQDVCGESRTPAEMSQAEVRDHVRKRLIVALHPDRRGSDAEFKQLQEMLAVVS